MKKFIEKLLIIFFKKLYLLKKIYFKHAKFEPKDTIFDMWDDDQRIECFKYFKKYFFNSVFLDTDDLRIHSILMIEEKRNNEKFLKLEFGVYKGYTANLFSKYCEKLYAFDSFQGLLEDWTGTSGGKRGILDLKGNIPKLKSNVVTVKGWVQDTLEDFLKNNNKKIAFIHMDLDTYLSSKYVLEKCKGIMCNDAVLLFDQFYNYPGWRTNEFKAFTEVFEEHEYTYKVFSKYGSQVAVQLNLK